MKKMTVLLSLLAVLVLGLSMTFANGPAVVIKDGGCNLFNTTGQLFFAPSSAHQVYSNDTNGNSKITCHATLPEGQAAPKKAVHWNSGNNNIKCSTGWGITDDWKAVITPSGKVMLTCHYKTP